MIFISLILRDFLTHASLLGFLFIGVLLVFLATFPEKWGIAPYAQQRNIDLQTLRRYLLSLLFMLALTIIYWIIDTSFLNLPDPVLPYTLYLLLIAVFFSTRVTLITAIFSFLLFDYFLFEPRYHLYDPHDALSILYSIVGLFITIFIGSRIRRYQRHLLQRTGELETLIRARDEFSAVAAHDLKNPITTIKLYTQMLGNHTAGERTEAVLSQSAETINRETDKLLSLVDSLLDFSKLQSGKMKLHKERFSFIDLCKQRVTAIQVTDPTHTFHFSSSLKRAPLLADRLAIDRVITNLLTNAAKYSPAETNISLTLEKKKDFYLAAIKDEGKGISKDDQKNLFQPFYQAASSKHGLGLGLYIVKTIVTLHGGDIKLDSKVGKGSTFSVYLPVQIKPKQ